LARLAAAVRRRLWVVALVAALFVGAAAAYLALSPPRYLATAQIIVDPRGLQVLDKEVSPKAQNSDVQVPLVESEMRVLKSTKVLDLLIGREGLERDPEFTKGRWSPVAALKSLVSDLVGRERRATDPRLAALRELDDRIAVRRAERSFVIDVTVATEDAGKSARLANALVQAYMEQNAAAQAEAARRSGEALAGRLEELKGRVRDAEDRVEQFKARNDMVGAGGRLVSDQQLSELNNQLGTARTRTAEARAKMEQIERLKRGGDAGAFTEAVQSQTVMALRAQYADVKRRHADLATKLGERHPDIAAVERELRDAQGSIAAEVARIASSARADYERAKASEEALQKSLDAQSRKAVSTAQDFVKLRELEREVEASRAVYEAALVRSRELKEQTLVDTTNVRHITVATPPLRPSGPPAALVLPIALAAGLLAGAGAAFAGRMVDRKVRSREDLERATGLPVLARVPRAPSESPLASFNAGTSEAKAFRRLLDEIGAASGAAAPRSVAVASVEADGGSANVAFNLARAAAALGDRVLLIDAGVEERRLTAILDCDGQPGLGVCAAQGGDLRAFVVSLQGAGMDFLPADPKAAAEIRRFGSAGLPRLVREAAQRYALVILDLGCASREPVARTAASAEAAVLLVELDRSAFETIKAAIAALRSGSGRVAGLALAGRLPRAA
jgi:succinoglycan biosynthesis transport protein ExoP